MKEAPPSGMSTHDGRVAYSRQGKSQEVQAGYVIIATGAMERPFPLPGWNLPGVMGAGAANNLAKEAGLVPSGKVVLAGSGPLLLLEANVLVKKGVHISRPYLKPQQKYLLQKHSRICCPPCAAPTFFSKGCRCSARSNTPAVPHYKGVSDIAALGKEQVEAVEAVVDGQKQTFPADLLLLHFGVIPNVHIFRLIGCAMQWNSEQRYWFPACDSWGRTNFEKIFAAGDGAGVSGALAAEYRGELAALEIARCLGILPVYERDALAAPLLAAIRRDALPRPFVDAMYAPRINGTYFKDETVLCRCENIRVADVSQGGGRGRPRSQRSKNSNPLRHGTMPGTNVWTCSGRDCCSRD